MSRESRLVVILLVIAAIGVSGLTFVASQYRKTLLAHGTSRGAGTEDASLRAVRRVNGFLAARQAAKAVAARSPGKIRQLTAVVTGDFSEVQGQRMSANTDAMSSYRIERYNAFSAHEMTYEDYAAVRAGWRSFRAGNPVDDPALLAAFQARAAELEQAALGPIEALDDAIK